MYILSSSTVCPKKKYYTKKPNTLSVHKVTVCCCAVAETAASRMFSSLSVIKAMRARLVFVSS